MSDPLTDALALLRRLSTLDGDGLFWERFHALQDDAARLLARVEAPTFEAQTPTTGETGNA